MPHPKQWMLDMPDHLQDAIFGPLSRQFGTDLVSYISKSPFMGRDIRIESASSLYCSNLQTCQTAGKTHNLPLQTLRARNRQAVIRSQDGCPILRSRAVMR